MRPWRRIVLASLGGASALVVAVWALATLGGGDRVSEGTSVPTSPPATAPPSAETTQPPPAGTTTSTSSTTTSTSTSTTTTTLLRIAATTTTTTTTTIDPFTPRERKEQARGDLDAILPTGDSQTDARLTDAVNRIHESLNPTYWLGESYLTDDGAKVFIAEEQAAVKLALVVKGGGSAAATAQAATDLLVDADRILAQNEIDVAVASGGAANKIQSARDQMARAEADVTAGEFHLAIIHFRQAWQRARSASKGLNLPPVEINLSNDTVDENAPNGTVVGTLTALDLDPGDTVTFSLVDDAGGRFAVAGSALVVADGSRLDFETDTSHDVTVRATDSAGGFLDEVFTIGVNDVNEVPTDLALDNNTVEEGQPAGTTVGTLTTTDQDAGDSHTYSLAAGSGDTDNASFQIAGDLLQTAVVFNVAADTPLSIRVRSTDAGGLFYEEALTVTVINVNDPPDARDDDVTTDEDSLLSGDVLGDNGNGADSDPDGDPLTVTEVNGNAGDVGVQITLASGALVTVNADGSFTYDPNGQFESLAVGESDTDTFAYTVSDGNGGSDTATVTVTITGVNDPPTATDDSGAGFTTDEDTAFTTGDVLANDTDPDASDTLAVASLDTTGTVGLVTDNGDGTFDYDPNGQFESLAVGDSATDTFAHTVSDGNGGTDSATVTITITGVDDTPLAVDDAATVSEDDPATTINVLGNDTDPDGGPKTIASASDPANGTVVVAGDSLSLSYEPDPNYCNDGSSTDDFTYTLSPGGSTATVEVTVTCVNDPPTATAPGPFNVIGNVSITVTDGPDDLLAGASDPVDGAGAQPFTVGGTVPTASVNGGDVTIDTSTGAFSYDPPPGFEGTDTFDYQVCDSGVPGSACSTPVTVTLNVAGMIWFVDAAAAAGGDGRLSAPFDDLAGTGSFDAVAADDPGDGIFLDDGTYTGGLTLLDNQALVGDGSSSDMATILGLTVPPYSAALPSFSGTAPLISGSSGGLTLAADNTARGFDLSTTGGTALLGTSVGQLLVTEVDTLTAAGGRAVDLAGGSASMAVDIGDVTVNSSGVGGISLAGNGGTTSFGSVDITTTGGTGLLASNTGTVNVGGTANTIDTTDGAAVDITSTSLGSGAIFAAVSSTSSPGKGINLGSVTGTFTVSAGSITGSSGVAVDVNAGGDNVTIGAGITNTTNRAVEVTNRTGGTVTFSGSIDDDGAGILLDSNAGATITFSGGLSLDTGVSTAFNAVNGGTVQVTGTNTIGSNAAPIAGVGVNIADTTIGAAGITFRNVDVSGAVSGIQLDDTGSSAGLTVTGDGGSAQNASGGTIANTSGDGISLNNTRNVSLNQMAFSFNGIHAVDGDGVVNFTLTNSTASNVGNANDENVFNFDSGVGSGLAAVSGTLVLNNVDVTDFHDTGLSVYNEAGSLTVDIDNSDFDDNDDTVGVDAIFVETEGSASLAMTVDGGTFNDLEGDAVVVEAGSTGTNDVDITGITSTNGGGPDNFPNGGGIELRVDKGATLTFDIKGNTIVDMPGDPLIISSATITGGGNLEGRVGGPNAADGNTFSGSSLGDGIQLTLEGPSTGLAVRNFTILIQNNEIGVDTSGVAGGPFNGLGDDGIQILHRDHAGTLNLTIEDNQLANTASEGIRFFSDEDLGGGSNDPQSNVRIAGNTFTAIGASAPPPVPSAIFLRLRDTAAGCFHVSGNSGNGLDGDFVDEIVLDNGGSLFEITQASTAALSTANNSAGVTPVGTITFNGSCTNPPLPMN